MVEFHHFLLTCTAAGIVISILGIYLWDLRCRLKGMTRSRDHWQKIVKDEITKFGNMFENASCPVECRQYHSPQCPLVIAHQQAKESPRESE